MKKFLFARAVVTIIFGLNFSAMDVPTVEVEQGSYQFQSGGEFEILNHGLLGRTAGTSFQSLCLEMYEYLSFDEMYFVDVSDVTLNDVRGGFSSDSLDPGTDTQLKPAS